MTIWSGTVRFSQWSFLVYKKQTLMGMPQVLVLDSLVVSVQVDQAGWKIRKF